MISHNSSLSSSNKWKAERVTMPWATAVVRTPRRAFIRNFRLCRATFTIHMHIKCRVFLTPVGDTVVFFKSNKYLNSPAHDHSWVCVSVQCSQAGAPDVYQTHTHTNVMHSLSFGTLEWNAMRRPKQPNRMNRINLRTSALPSLYFTTYLWMIIINVSIVWLNAYVTFDVIAERSSIQWASLLNLHNMHTEEGWTNSSD